MAFSYESCGLLMGGALRCSLTGLDGALRFAYSTWPPVTCGRWSWHHPTRQHMISPIWPGSMSASSLSYWCDLPEEQHVR